jgi:TolB-like protein
MRGKGVRTCGALLAVGLFLAGCSFGRINSRDFAQPGAVLPAGSTVAVLPFENLTNHPNAGQIAADIVSTELYGVEGLRSMDAARVRSRLSAGKPAADATDAPADAAPLDAQAAGRTLGVDAVLAGSVSEYGYQHGLREEPVVGLNARLVRSSDGTVLWTSSQSEAGRGYFSRDSVNNVAQRVVTRMIDSLRPVVAPAAESDGANYGTAPARRASDADFRNDLHRE